MTPILAVTGRGRSRSSLWGRFERSETEMSIRDSNYFTVGLPVTLNRSDRASTDAARSAWTSTSTLARETLAAEASVTERVGGAAPATQLRLERATVVVGQAVRVDRTVVLRRTAMQGFPHATYARAQPALGRAAVGVGEAARGAGRSAHRYQWLRPCPPRRSRKDRSPARWTSRARSASPTNPRCHRPASEHMRTPRPPRREHASSLASPSLITDPGILG